MIIDCISDLHGHYPELEGGDLLIVAGDWTAQHTFNEMAFNFITWLDKQQYKKKVIIAGNHDTMIVDDVPKLFNGIADYLQDSGIQFEDLKIWGSPWSRALPGMNLKCKAFTVDTEEKLAEKWILIPQDVDILVTHSPPHGYLDLSASHEKRDIRSWGSKSLQAAHGRIKPRLHVFGHIHEGYGQYENRITTFVNASHVNEYYDPVNEPIRIKL